MARMMYEQKWKGFFRICDICEVKYQPLGKCTKLCDDCQDKKFLIGLQKRMEMYRQKREFKSKDGKGGNNIS